MPKDDWVFWLNVTNIALGVVVFLAVLLVAYAVVGEIVARYKRSRGEAHGDGELQTMLRYGRTVPGLGVTMTDGGDRVKSLPEQREEKKSGEA